MEHQDIINKITDKMKNKMIVTDDYKFTSILPDGYKLSDKVVIYYTGQWKIIQLKLFTSYPVIYDVFSEEDISYDISVIVCPITLRCTVLKGLFVFETYDNLRMILREKGTETLIPIDMGTKINSDHVLIKNRRSEIRITILRNAIRLFTDANFLSLNKDIKYDSVVNLDYYLSSSDIIGKEIDGLIHPKTLVYLIQYKSQEDEKEKISVLLGKDCSKISVTGYDIKASGLLNYLEKYKNKIINKEGYIIPMLWFMVKEIYNDYKVIYIT